MGQLFASQTTAAQVLADDIELTDAFENELRKAKPRFNVVVEVNAFRNNAVSQEFGYWASQTTASQVLPEDEEAAVNTLPDNVLLRFSSRPIKWRHDDEVEPNGYAEVRLATRSDIESTINLSPTTESGGVTNIGSLIIHDKDRFIGPYLKEYNFGGREVTILLGPEDSPRKDYRKIITAYATGWRRTIDGRATLTLQDQRFQLDVPFQTTEFDGTGLLGGTADLIGTRKPRLIGWRPHIEPPIIDPATGLRMVNDGAYKQVLAGYFGGEEANYAGDFPTTVALLDADIPEGSYGTCYAQGTILPVPALGYDGPFTVSAYGDDTYGWTDHAGQLIVQELRRAGIPSYAINSAAFSFMDASCGYWYTGGDVTRRQVIEQLALSAGGRIASDLLFTAVRLQPPETVLASAEYEEHEIEQLEYRGTIGPPVVTWILRYAFNDRQLNTNEILLPDENIELKTYLQKPYETLPSSSAYANYRYVYRLASVLRETLINDIDSARALATFLKSFFSVERHLWSAKLPARALTQSVGSVIKLTTNEEQIFVEGKNTLVVANRRLLEELKSVIHVVI